MPKALSLNLSAGSSSAPSPGSTAAVDSPKTGKTATTMRLPSSTSLQSVSCSEGYVIPHEVSGRTLSLRLGLRALLLLGQLHPPCQPLMDCGRQVGGVAARLLDQRRVELDQDWALRISA